MKVRGLESIERWLNQNIDDVLVNVSEDWADDVIKEASNKADVDVKNDFSYKVTKDGNKFVISLLNDNILAVYHEFGTGGQVFQNTVYNFTGEDKIYASNFIVNKKGRTFATPALYPSYFEARAKLIADLELGLSKVYR